MEDLLEDLIREQCRPLAINPRIEVEWNGSAFTRSNTSNLEAKILGTYNVSFTLLCKTRDRRSVFKLGLKVRDAVNGLRPESVSPLIPALCCTNMSYTGVDGDELHGVSITVNTQFPYIKEQFKC